MSPLDGAYEAPIAVVLYPRECHIQCGTHEGNIHPYGDVGQRRTLDFVQGGAVSQAQRKSGGGETGAVLQAALLCDRVNQEHFSFVRLHLHPAVPHTFHDCAHAVHEAVLFVRVLGDGHSHSFVDRHPERLRIHLH